MTANNVSDGGGLDALEQALVDLGDHLDEPDGRDLPASVVEAVRAEARRPAAGRVRSSGSSAPLRFVATGVVLIAMAVGLVAFAPARQAIAQLFGVGAVEIKDDAVPPTTGGQPIPGGPGPGSALPSSGEVRAVSLAEARRQLPFRVRVPEGEHVGSVGPISIDDRTPGGLLTLTYPRFTVVEVASPEGEAPVVGKSVQPGTRLQPVGISGHPGIWLEGDPHSVGYLDREGRFQPDTVRRAGNVLVWTADGATYRLEGDLDLATALALARSMMTS